MKRVFVSWSSGKDAAWSLHLLRQNPNVNVEGLVCTVNSDFDRVSLHGTRRSLLHKQATALRLPLTEIAIPKDCTNEMFEKKFVDFARNAQHRGIDFLAFGDLHLRHVRRRREFLLAPLRIQPLFPLWGLQTDELARSMISSGLKAKLVCVDTSKLPEGFAGRDFDSEFLKDLPHGVDPCGENGEFHTFVYGGPMFQDNLDVRSGEMVVTAGFAFMDLVLDDKRNVY